VWRRLALFKPLTQEGGHMAMLDVLMVNYDVYALDIVYSSARKTWNQGIRGINNAGSSRHAD
jgi:hypothetical protein